MQHNNDLIVCECFLFFYKFFHNDFTTTSCLGSTSLIFVIFFSNKLSRILKNLLSPFRPRYLATPSYYQKYRNNLNIIAILNQNKVTFLYIDDIEIYLTQLASNQFYLQIF